MTATTLIGLINYAMVLIYGSVLSVSFAGGCRSIKQRAATALMCLLILFAQTSCYFVFGFDITKKLYPIIAHLPLVLMLTLLFKRKLAVAITSVMTGYFCCQLPRWFGCLALFFLHSNLAYQISYMISIIPFLFLLRRYLAPALYQAMTYSGKTLLLFGILPFSYYIFDYATTVYSAMMYEGARVISEFLPAIMALFYVIFITVYHSESQRRNQLEIENIMLTSQTKQAENEIKTLRQTQEQASSYRHDLRHHMNLLHSLLESGQVGKALDYLTQAQTDIDNITPLHFCENETANLLFSSFAEKAKQQNITLSVRAQLPIALRIPDTDLCSVLSNGIENALLAVDSVEDVSLRKIAVDCRMERNMMLLEIENAYLGTVQIKDGLPQTSKSGHGFGCRSIRSIAENRKGFCIFRAEGGIFTLRVVLPQSPEDNV